MLVRTLAIVMGLAIVVACSDNSNVNKNTKEALVLSGGNGLSGGKGTINVELKRGDAAVTDQAGTEVTLTVVCSSEQSKSFTAKLDAQGKASVDIDLSGEGWEVSDWSACKISAKIKTDAIEVKAEEVDLKTIAQRQGAGGALTAYEIGEEISRQSLGGGRLQLRGCTDVTLFIFRTTGIRVATGLFVPADTSTQNFPAMFVLGTPGAACKLQHVLDDTTRDLAMIVIRTTPANKTTAALKVGMAEHTDSQSVSKLRVSLPAKPSNFADSTTAYVSDNSGKTWATKAVKNLVWKDHTDTIAWDATKPYAYQLLLRTSLATAGDSNSASGTASNSNDAAWWSLHKIQHSIVVEAVTVGKMFTVSGISSSTISRNIATTVVDTCGLQLFAMSDDNGSDRPMRRIKNKDTTIDVPANATSVELLAVDRPVPTTSSYRSGCNIKLNVGGAVVAPASTSVSKSRPWITGITVSQGGNRGDGGKYMKVTLPAWKSSHGTKGATSIEGTNDDGHTWGILTSAAGWGKERENEGHQWNTNDPTAKHAALVLVEVNSKWWWYYATAK